jgi:hypothetical protein
MIIIDELFTSQKKSWWDWLCYLVFGGGLWSISSDSDLLGCDWVLTA